jgi:hypothetical protein
MAPVSARWRRRALTVRTDRFVEARERLVKQHQSWAVQERSLEGQPLTHAARKPRDLVIGPIDKPRAFERGGTAAFGSRP